MIISSSDKKVLYLSNCWIGKTHDYTMLKQEFPPEENWFKKFVVRVDLGYLGIDKDYVCKEIILPHKKKKKQELSEEQKNENKNKSKERIHVEHSIGGMKRYRILSERLRIHDFGLYNDVLEVCAGLWNFYLDA